MDREASLGEGDPLLVEGLVGFRLRHNRCAHFVQLCSEMQSWKVLWSPMKSLMFKDFVTPEP
jgi:hypothetical protein